MNNGGGRRERKKHETAAALHEAALALFLEKGFAETTVEEIADAVDVSARTFFRYFPSKESVVYADELERREVWLAAMRARPCDERLLDSLREAALVLAAEYRPDRDFARWELAGRNPAILAAALQTNSRWEHAVATEVARRLGLASRNDLTARMLSIAAMGAFRAAQAEWFHGKGRRSLRSHVRRAFAVLDGIHELEAAPIVIPSDHEGGAMPATASKR